MKWLRFLFVALLFSISGCDEESEIADMKPYSEKDQVQQVNRRIAKPGKCQLKLAPESDTWIWYDDPGKRFAEKVIAQGASSNNWSILEIDMETFYIAFQVALSKGKVQMSDKDRIIQRAKEQLFKENAKSFILMHNNNDVWAITGSEPKLYPQSEENGRLVRMCRRMGDGIRKGEIALLMFENKVCQEDVSYTVGMNFNVAKKDEDLGSWFSSENRSDIKFVIGGEQSPLAMLGSVYKPIVSKYPGYKAKKKPYVNVRGVDLSFQDWLAIAQFALDLIAFIPKI